MPQTLDPTSFYMQLGRLIAEAPEMSADREPGASVFAWLGKAQGLLSQSSDPSDGTVLKQQGAKLASAVSISARREAIAQILMTVNNALAIAEAEAPVSFQGTFILSGNTFDAMVAVAKVLQRAVHEVLLVDPYMDAKALTDFAVHSPEQITIKLLADAAYYKLERWLTQYGAKRPLEARLAAPKTLHDRLISLDGQDAWTLTQSLNAFAARSPASIVRVDAETAALKVAYYEAAWQSAMRL